MNFSLKPRLFLMGVLPGFVFLLGIIVIKKNYNLKEVTTFIQNISLSLSVVLVIISFIVGQVFDSIRDAIIETVHWYIFRNNDINWDFFPRHPKPKSINWIITIIFIM